MKEVLTMLYYSTEARQSHINRITELVNIINSVPVDTLGGYQNVSDIVKYLNEYRTVINKEMKESK